MASLNERDDDRTERPVSRPRSRNFPAMSLGKAVDWLSEIRDALGFKPFSKTMLAQAFNLSSTSGSFFAKVGAMNAYGLLEGSSEQLRISDVGKRILAPQSDEDRRNAIQKAFQTPDLFADLLRDFGGSPLPQQLANRLLHQYSITAASKDVAAQSFIESARFAGLLEDSGVLRQPYSPGDDYPTAAPQPSTSATLEIDKRIASVPQGFPTFLPNYQTFSFLTLTGKTMFIAVPEDLVLEDVQDLLDQVELIRRRTARRSRANDESTDSNNS